MKKVSILLIVAAAALIFGGIIILFQKDNNGVQKKLKIPKAYNNLVSILR